MVMNQVLHYIEEHLKEPLDSKQLASVAGKYVENCRKA